MQPTPNNPRRTARLERLRPRGGRTTSSAGLLDWFRVVCHDQLPDRIHLPVVARAPVQASHTRRDGSPGLTEAFEGYLMGNPWERDVDGSYRRPLQAALATMSKAHPEAVRRLRVLAKVDADTARAAELLGWDREVAWFYFDGALRRLLGIYLEDVPARCR